MKIFIEEEDEPLIIAHFTAGAGNHSSLVGVSAMEEIRAT